MVGAAIAPLFAEEARARMVEGRNQYSPGANLPEGSEDDEDHGRARDHAAAAVNVSPRSVESAG